MTLYLFYKKSPKEFDTNPILYAFTNNKDFASDFKKYRNMNKFIFRKETDISKSEYNSFSSKWHKCELTLGQFYTRGEVFGKRIPVTVLCTYREEETVLINSDRLWEQYSDRFFDANIINNKYLSALNNLLYFKFYGFFKLRPKYDVSDFYEPYYTAYGPPTDFILSEIQDGYDYDDLRLFLRFFGDTFK